jgi:hypothetical protein
MDQLVVRLQEPNLRGSDDPELTWVNVGIALSFILIDGNSCFPLAFVLICSRSFHRSWLGSRKVRPCRFGTMSHSTHHHGKRQHDISDSKGLVLDSVFTSQNPFFIFGLVFLLIFLGAFEAVYNRSKKRYDGMVYYSTWVFSCCSF